MNTSLQAPRFGLVIVGDEILSGKREDKHFAKVIELLKARGLRLSWVQYLPDERAAITEALRQTFASADVVFSCGGIGSTPDDHTRQAAAAALGVPVVLHPEAAALIAQRCADMAAEGRGAADMSTPENRQRLKMGEFPQGARIVPNPYNRIPGFGVADHWFFPGFPVMAWPMIEWVLDHHYTHCFNLAPQGERSLLVFETPESAIAPLMESVEAEFPGIRAFSLPSVGDGQDGRPRRRHIELGVKGDRDVLAAAYAQLVAGLRRLDAPYSEGADGQGADACDPRR
jgi:molybdopterin-biosynthesis enzyme MoeA-like protein